LAGCFWILDPLTGHLHAWIFSLISVPRYVVLLYIDVSGLSEDSDRHADGDAVLYLLADSTTMFFLIVTNPFRWESIRQLLFLVR
jgi:hypothetical protein